MIQSKIIKKMTPFAIAAVLTLTLFAVFAAPAVALTPAYPVCEIIRAEESYAQYFYLGDALADVQDGDTIKLQENIDYYAHGISIEDIRVTFDVNGFILNVTCADETTGRDALDVNGGDVLLIDTSSSGGGEFNVVTLIENGAGVYARNGGKANVTNAAGYYGVYANASAAVKVAGNVSGVACGVYANNSAVTVDGVIETENQYIIVDDTEMAETGHKTTSTRPGYFEYAGGKGSVWVKDPAASNGGGSGANGENQTKIGGSLFLIGGLALVLVLAAAVLFYMQKMRK